MQDIRELLTDSAGGGLRPQLLALAAAGRRLLGQRQAIHHSVIAQHPAVLLHQMQDMLYVGHHGMAGAGRLEAEKWKAAKPQPLLLSPLYSPAGYK